MFSLADMLCEGNLFSGFLQEVVVCSQYFETIIMEV